jgi:hypothetical protein
MIKREGINMDVVCSTRWGKQIFVQRFSWKSLKEKIVLEGLVTDCKIILQLVPKKYGVKF